MVEAHLFYKVCRFKGLSERRLLLASYSFRAIHAQIIGHSGLFVVQFCICCGCKNKVIFLVENVLWLFLDERLNASQWAIK